MKGTPLTLVAVLFLTAWHGGCRSRTSPTADESGTPDQPSVSWRFEYDDSDRLAAVIDPGGRRTTFEYRQDDSGRLVQWSSNRADGTRVTHGLDHRGRRSDVTDPAGKTRYAYDGFDRLIAVQRDGQPEVRYGYDALDRLVSLRVGETFEIRYAYDFLGRLARMETPVGPVTYEYRTAPVVVIRTIPVRIKTVWEYCADRRLKKITHAADGNRLVGQFTYTYRPDGLVASVTELGPDAERTVSYEYDTMHRLTKAADSRYGMITYRYDLLGNRTERTIDGKPPVASQYDWAGRLTHHAGRDCTHDAVGNLTSIASEEGQRAFCFDAANLLTSATVGHMEVSYRYDGDGCPIGRQARQRNPVFVYQGKGHVVVRQTDERNITFVPDYRSEFWRPLAAVETGRDTTYYVWDGDAPLATFSGRPVEFLLGDMLGSVRMVAGADGQLRHFDYTPFGVPFQEMKSDYLLRGFAGLLFDPQVSLYLTRTRAYDPALGRFLQEDPHRPAAGTLPQEISLFAYCGNDPVNFVDLGKGQPGISSRPGLESDLRPARSVGSTGDMHGSSARTSP